MRIKCFILFLIGLVLSGCGPDQPEANFAFRFAYGSCYTSTLDTFDQTFQTVVGDMEQVTIPVTLGNEQMTAIYQKMMAIDYFSYPEVFRIRYGDNDVVGMVTPAIDYRITVQNGEQNHEVFWHDEITDPTSQEAEQLRELFKMIMEMIANNPDVQNLPPLNVGCA